MQQTILKWSSVFFLAGAWLTAASAGAQEVYYQGNAPRIKVGGEAEVRVVPDEVLLTLGVETRDPLLLKAKVENDRRVKNILAQAEEHKVETRHIQTDYLNIEPRYEKKTEERTFLGYFVRRSVIITLRDISRFDALLTAVLEDGAHYVHGIEFRTTALREHRDRARLLAIKAAREKAELVARELGSEVGPPLSITVPGGRWRSAYQYHRWDDPFSRLNAGLSQNATNAPLQAEVEGTVAPGQIAVTARVDVIFALQ